MQEHLQPHLQEHLQDKPRPRFASSAKWVLLGFALIAAYFLITEHRAHLAGALEFLPYLLLLACPLMHIFMHHGHGGHHHHQTPPDDAAGEKK